MRQMNESNAEQITSLIVQQLDKEDYEHNYTQDV